jgi:hypothetical protein
MPKKKFKDTKVGKFIIGKNGIASVLADSIPDKGVLGLVKNLIDDDKGLTPQDKETALKLLEMDEKELEAVTRRWEADAKSDSKLAKIVRPLIILYLTFVVSLYIVLDSLDVFKVETHWIDLITTLTTSVYIAYFSGRSIEKYAQIKKV